MLYDHCHSTGLFRGWLCRRCNVGIGFLGDDIQGILEAAAYLEKYGTDYLLDPEARKSRDHT